MVWRWYSIRGRSTLLYMYEIIGPVVYLDLRDWVMVEILSLIFSLPGFRIEFLDKWIPRILIDSFLGRGVIEDWVCGWEREELKLFRIMALVLLVLLGLIVISLVFLGWIEMLLIERNWEVMLSRLCVSWWFFCYKV